jgi:DNA repair exonuclease SbcCD nuclease subunit
MKWNIFARLNTLEKELNELREIVRFQNNTIVSLQIDQIKNEGNKLVTQETAEERRNRQKREYYARNKAAITERRNIKKNLEEAKQKGDSKKAWYWKNVEQRRAYNREYYKKKKLTAQAT